MTTFRSDISGGAVLIAAALSGTASQAQEFVAPSGQTVSLLDVIAESQPELVRFRFIAPAIDPAGDGLAYETVADDFVWLCEQVALPALVKTGHSAPEVVISLSDRAVEFGVATPEATQFFEPFAITEGRCIWEQY